MINYIIIFLVAALGGYAGFSYVKKLKKGGDCCGSHEEAPKTVKVADKNKAHYPYEAILFIDGMSCENCAKRVENALNGLEGTWAQVNLGDSRAKVLLKEKPDIEKMAGAVRAAGYTVIKRESVY
mgnify:CR=1 FL=1